MTAIQYYRDGRPWDDQTIQHPTWADVDAAVRRMDNYCFPIVSLNTSDDEENEDLFEVVGGNGTWALLQFMGKWQFRDPLIVDDKEVWLWDSDQGYACKQYNIITDVEKVLRIVRVYCDTGSYAGLDAVE